MREQTQQLPPTALKLLAWICPAHLLEEIEGDLIQKFNRDSEIVGLARAKRRSVINSIRYFRPGIVLRGNLFKNKSISLRPMTMHFDFNRINNLIGWIVFSLAFLTYTLTVEETASLWDCSEFIATSYKLQVPHPPGAPFFLL